MKMNLFGKIISNSLSANNKYPGQPKGQSLLKNQGGDQSSLQQWVFSGSVNHDETLAEYTAFKESEVNPSDDITVLSVSADASNENSPVLSSQGGYDTSQAFPGAQLFGEWDGVVRNKNKYPDVAQKDLLQPLLVSTPDGLTVPTCSHLIFGVAAVVNPYQAGEASMVDDSAYQEMIEFVKSPKKIK